MNIAVSACLLGENCKYNGGNNLTQKVCELNNDNNIIKVCPEVLAGAGVPRTPVEIKDGRLINKFHEDVHEQYMLGVKKALEVLSTEDIDLVVLQSRSPTCGVKEVYNGDFNKTLISGLGVFAKALVENGYKVLDVEDL